MPVNMFETRLQFSKYSAKVCGDIPFLQLRELKLQVYKFNNVTHTYACHIHSFSNNHVVIALPNYCNDIEVLVCEVFFTFFSLILAQGTLKKKIDMCIYIQVHSNICTSYECIKFANKPNTGVSMSFAQNWQLIGLFIRKNQASMQWKAIKLDSWHWNEIQKQHLKKS